jgi:hypothetical protein
VDCCRSNAGRQENIWLSTRNRRPICQMLNEDLLSG